MRSCRGAGGSPFRPPPGYIGVPATYEQFLRDFYRLDEPWLVEFAHYVKNVFTLDFGPSLVQRNVSVDYVVEHAAPITLQLVVLAAMWSIPLGIATGLAAAAYRNRWLDRLLTSTSTVLLVVPVFFVAYVTGRYVAREWHLVELGWENWDTRLVASLVLALAPIGYVARLVRAAVVDELVEDYVRTASAKGLRRSRILGLHVLRNSLTPFLSAAVPLLALLVTGAFFVEDAFGIPGASPVLRRGGPHTGHAPPARRHRRARRVRARRERPRRHRAGAARSPHAGAAVTAARRWADRAGALAAIAPCSRR